MFLSPKKKSKRLFFALGAASFVLLILTVFFSIMFPRAEKLQDDIISFTKDLPQVFTSPTPSLPPTPVSYVIPQRLHVFQSFNNCGPATLSMALSYANIQKDQSELGQLLRPYQVAGGDNDDKSVTLQEVSDQAKTYGLSSYLRPNGSIEKLKQLVSNDIPVVTRTWLKTNEDIGHYRIIRGYDDSTQEIIQDDSLQGKNLRFSYNEFNELWQPFNYEYLVIVPVEKTEIVERILGEDLNENTAWKNAQIRIDSELSLNPENLHLKFALSRIYYYLGDFEKSVEYFNEVENQISFRTLWYQIEPLLSIYETGDYERVLVTTEKILNNQNRAYSEAYVLRGKVFETQGNTEAAKQEYQKAVMYNASFASKIPNL